MKPFVKQDIDGFFGLFVDNLVQLIVIVLLCSGLCGMSGENSRFLYDLVFPGVAVSLLIGNVFYALQAHWLARKTGRDDVTALPYGINTPSVIIYIFFVMKPAYDRSGGDVDLAWRLGLLACLGSGLIEFGGSFVAHWIKRWTPRAALLSTLAGIAIGFISMQFALFIFQKPLLGMLPLAVVLVGFFARVPFPFGLPSGFVAVLTGTGLAWLMTLLSHYIPQAPTWLTLGAASPEAVSGSLSSVGFRLPIWCGSAISETWNDLISGDRQQLISLITIVVPMGLFNVIGSLQNIESAEAAGDKFGTLSSMSVNGLGTIAAALFGSCFPTTIYIGHPGWKALGARAGYSTLNGLVITLLCLFGLVGGAAAIIPVEAGAAIILWIGIIITAQAFKVTQEDHAPAVAVGLFPAIAAWGATVVMGAFGAAGGQTLQELVTPLPVVSRAQDEPLPFPSLDSAPLQGEAPADEVAEPAVEPGSPAPAPPAVKQLDRVSLEVNGYLLHALLLFERGFIFTCMFMSAACANLIDRKFNQAGIWMLVSALFTWLGIMHAYQVYGGFAFDYIFRFVAPVDGAYVYRADDIFVAYMLCAMLFFSMSFWASEKESVAHL